MGINVDTVSSLFFRTPMRDLLRGRVTGRHDVERMIKQSGLSDSASQCISKTIKLTHLWPTENIDVANELIAHFLDGLKADSSLDEMLENYGNERHTARLIRRAKLRQRPIFWHLFKWLRRSVIVLFLAYLLVLIRFLTGSPQVKTDYFASLNARTMAVPEEQRAWPLYREALVTMQIADAPTRELLRQGSEPGSPDWDAVAAYLQEHHSSLELLCAGSEKPVLGLPFLPTREYNENDRRALGITPEELDAIVVSDKHNGPPEVGLIHWRALWNVIRPLTLDTRLAISESDGDRVARNIKAILLTFSQFQGPSHGMFHGYGNWVIGRTRDLLTQILIHDPQLLTDQQLRDLAHLLASTDTRPEESLKSLSMTFEHYIQWLYTDDGQGDGRITPAGLHLLEQEHGEGFWLNTYANAGFDTFDARGLMQQSSIHLSLSPLAMIHIASRKEIMNKLDELNRITIEELEQPLWINAQSSADAQMKAWSYGDRARYMPLRVLRHEYGYFKRDAEDFRGQKEGMLVGIALELYRREYGYWPKTLNDLTPGYLPSVPLDRLSGDPLRYRVTDDGPIVYSVGVDGDDDGGTPDYDEDVDGNLHLGYVGPRYYNGHGPVDDGDWILWPVPREE